MAMEEPRGERWIPGPQPSPLTHHTPNQACSSIFIIYWATVILPKESFLQLAKEKESGCAGAIHCPPSETGRRSNWVRALPVTHGDTGTGAVSNLDFSLRVPSLFPQPQPGAHPVPGSEPGPCHAHFGILDAQDTQHTPGTLSAHRWCPLPGPGQVPAASKGICWGLGLWFSFSPSSPWQGSSGPLIPSGEVVMTSPSSPWIVWLVR